MLASGGRLGLGLFEVVDEFLILVSIVNGEFEFAFFGPENDGLPFHAADHVEGGFGLAAQRHLQQVFLNAGLDGVAERRSNFEEAIRGTETFNALVRPLVVVIFDPEFDPFPGGVETLELGAGEELLPDRFPEAFNFAQRHGMMGTGFEVMGPVLFHLGLEAGGAPPVDELPAVIGEHLFGRLIFARRDPKHLQHVFGRVAAKQIGPHDEAGIVIHERDDIGIPPPQSEGEDVGLPHLIGRGPLEEPGPGEVAPRLGRRGHQALRLERPPDGLRTGLQEEHPFEQLGDPFDAPGGFRLFEFEDFAADRRGQVRPAGAVDFALQALFAVKPILVDPFRHGRMADAQFTGHQLLGEALLEVQFDRAQPLLKGAAHNFSRRSPPRGGGGLFPLLLYCFILLHVTLLYH